MHKAALIWFLALGLAACGVSPTGRSAPYVAQNQMPLRVVMPPNAPSIVQQFVEPPSSVNGRQGALSHLGIDISDQNRTPILAAAPGVVTVSRQGPAYGNQVEITHPGSPRRITRYLHMTDRLVTPGQPVARGTQIGTMGDTGFLAKGVQHLHFEVQIQTPGDIARSQDPNLFWADGQGRVTCYSGQPEPPGRFATTYPVPCH